LEGGGAEDFAELGDVLLRRVTETEYRDETEVFVIMAEESLAHMVVDFSTKLI